MASENCQMLLKIMTISSLAVQILKKKKKTWREIRLVFSGNYILSGFLALVLQNKENYHEKYNKKPHMNSENRY